jgi:glycosyltransferase involved in cell wall biosynthesis
MSTTRPIHQLVHTLSYGDAISTEVLGLQRAIRASGRDSEIFAIHEHPRLKGRSRHYSTLNAGTALAGEEADLIMHYSLGSPLNALYTQWSRGRRVLIYHNVTPAKWYAGINQRVAADIEQGLSELPALCGVSDALWADSEFNAHELAQLGFSASVLDLSVDPERWDAPRNEGIYSLVRSTPGIHLLHVGRIAPNKCIEDVIKAFYFLHRFIQRESRLWLVGIDTDTELYSFALRRLVAALGIEHAVEFAGCLADEEVRSLYEACSVYMCMSEHEGFCLPIIEAMHFGLPVIGFDAGALPQTIGTGGIVVKEKRHASLAHLVAELAAETQLRGEVVARGKERVKQFQFEAFSRRVGQLLSQLDLACTTRRAV